MTRYFIDFQDGDKLIRDNEGSVVPTFADARTEADEMLQQIRKRELMPTYHLVLELVTLAALDGGAVGDGIGRGLIRGS